MTEPKYAQRHTKLNAPVRNKQNPKNKTEFFIYIKAKNTHHLMTFPQTTKKRRKQTKHTKNALVSSWNYLHETSLTCLKSTNSMTTSKLMCKPITSRTSSVTCVSSAQNTISTTPQKHVLINPLPSEFLLDRTAIPLKQKTAPAIVSISYSSFDQHLISQPYFYFSC